MTTVEHAHVWDGYFPEKWKELLKERIEEGICFEAFLRNASVTAPCDHPVSAPSQPRERGTYIGMPKFAARFPFRCSFVRSSVRSRVFARFPFLPPPPPPPPPPPTLFARESSAHAPTAAAASVPAAAAAASARQPLPDD